MLALVIAIKERNRIAEIWGWLPIQDGREDICAPDLLGMFDAAKRLNEWESGWCEREVVACEEFSV